ncbi:hypothetical protein Q1695_003337 [Nippostrongylus brasiliensis]|nr:hypothetical protein Q1695_003337 [Nippostrongylus brasiliensis]
MPLDDMTNNTIVVERHLWILDWHSQPRLYQETFDHGNVTYKAWDIGFHARLRGLYKCNFVSAKCFIFVVDCTDRARMHWIRDEIQELVQDRLRRGVPLLIYANKQDLPDALTPEEIEKALDLQKIRDRQWYVQPSCAVTGVGLGEGLDWLQATIAASKWWITSPTGILCSVFAIAFVLFP